jgi:BioD-like phosphotransacetylase family protein
VAKKVATQVQAKSAADLKDIASNLGKEVVAAKNDDAPGIIEQVEEAAREVAEDVAEGVEKAGEAIEEHPELLLEYVFPAPPTET